jgi:hypothetical protein
MSVIEDLNWVMPTSLDKTTDEYIAIFGNEAFTPISPIEESSDFQCGGVANELEYVKGFIDYITRTNDLDDFQGTYLEKIIYWFTGLTRWFQETDASFIHRFKALVERGGNLSWITTWMLRDVFEYFFEQDIYVIENYVLDELILDGSFETDPATNWPISTTGGSAIAFVAHDMFYGMQCAEFAVDTIGSDCYMQQTVLAVPLGNYVFSFATKDDRAITGDLFKVILQRSSDSYYYNFTTMTWQAGATYKTIIQNASTKYEFQQSFIVVDAGTAGDDLTFTFENIGGTSMAYKFYIDKVSFGTMLDYPSVKLVLIDENLAGGFMSGWSGGADPVSGSMDYTQASYYEQSYISGFGGEGILPYFQLMLSIIHPAGVSSLIEVLWRSHE